ncbi:hypothetical protein H0H87_008779 [Tephrocybe sp. NHM501043]|nr:hypothetical protein H0H87_008779 [Tephrocybe sp. NHM501043]
MLEATQSTLDGTAQEPTDPVTDNGRLKPVPTPTEDTEESMPTIMRPRQLTPAEEEDIVKQQIAGTIPDLLFMKIHGFGSVQNIWEALVRDFEKKSQMASVDLRRHLQEEKYAEKADVHAHFTKL